MAGLLEGFIAGAAGFGAKQIERSLLADMQEERDARLAELQKERDTRLNEQAEGREIRKEERSVKRMKDIGEEADKAGNAKTEDSAGNVIDQSPSEKAESRAKVFTKHGLIDEARKERDTESTRQYREEQGVRENRRINIDQERLESQERHQRVTEDLQRATEGRLRAVADAQLTQINLDLGTKQEIRNLYAQHDAAKTDAEKSEIYNKILVRLGKAKELPDSTKEYLKFATAENAAYAKAEADGMQLSPAMLERRDELRRQVASLVSGGGVSVSSGPKSDRPPLASFDSGANRPGVNNPAKPEPQTSRSDLIAQINSLSEQLKNYKEGTPEYATIKSAMDKASQKITQQIWK